ncbi:hypothetical protein LguiA_011595 [Lonicera macranthoides]
MESSDSSLLNSFKSKKKVIHSGSKPLQSDQVSKAPDQSPWSSKTPEKPTNQPRRSRRTAMSLKEVRQFAQKLQKSGMDPPNQPDPLGSGKQQTGSFPAETLVAKSKKADAKLPEKYEILDKFFSSLDSSIRLVRLKGGMSTFTNISPKIECLTDRRFTHGHLAQLKFILPEAIEISKVLIVDEHTRCMKPDLHVTLNINAIQDEKKLKSDSGNLLLRKVFRARLFNFFRAHPEVDEVPEETLPEPFNRSKQDLSTNAINPSNLSSMSNKSPIAISQQRPAVASHLSQFFKRQFSKQVSTHQSINTNQEPSVVSLETSLLPVLDPHFDQNSSTKKVCTSSAQSPMELSSKSTSGKVGPQPSYPPATPIKELVSASSMGTANIEVTPAKFASTPAKLISATPALQPPKRCYMSPDDDSNMSPNKLVRRPERSRSLKFDTPVKNTKAKDEVSESGMLSVDDDIFDILPENLLHSIREKEKKVLEEQSPAISQAKRRQKMIAGLPKLFDRLHFLFQSIKRSVITKEELMHRIITSHLDIIDRRDVDEQLRLLQEIVPEWIYEKSATSGDLLVG